MRIKLGLLLFVLFFACQCNERAVKMEDKSGDIFSKNEFRVAIKHNATDYFIYRGAPMGYHYELVQRFAQRHGLMPVFIICKTSLEAMMMLHNGDCDLIAMHLSVTDDRTKEVRFTTPFPEFQQTQDSICFNEKTAWAVAHNMVALCDSLDAFFDDFLNSAAASALYSKYYPCRTARYRQYSLGDGHITLWDETLKRACEKYGFDWLLVASLMYQESKFDVEASGAKGAFGLMQMMPETMERYGIDSLSTPEEHIFAAVRYLASLEKIFAASVADPFERMKFVIAAYNSGPGHILDAQRLTKTANGDPARWNEVAPKLLDKTNPEVYRTHEDVKHGYCNGTITVNYVNKIFERYEHYQIIMNYE